MAVHVSVWKWCRGEKEENDDPFKNLIIKDTQSISLNVPPIASPCPCFKLILAFYAQATLWNHF